MFKFLSEAQARKTPVLKLMQNGQLFPWAFLEQHKASMRNLSNASEPLPPKVERGFHFLMLSQNRIYAHALASQWHELFRKHAKRRGEAAAAAAARLRVSELVLVHDPVWRAVDAFARWQVRRLVRDDALEERIWILRCARKELQAHHAAFPPALKVATPASLKVMLLDSAQQIRWQHEGKPHDEDVDFIFNTIKEESSA